ncbi:MAG: hypothetical protein ACRYF2_01815 [Janthinobacterium lividum]
MTTYPLGLYVGNPNGNDPAANEVFLDAFDAFKTVMGVSPQFMNTFVDFGQDPSQWTSNAGWSAWSWAKTGSGYVGPGSGVIPVIGVPLASNADGWGNADTFYKSIISGTLDAPYKGIITSWASQGYSTLQLRLGYEFNGNFMPWSPGNSVSPTANADFVAAWQHVATLVHDQGAASGITVQTIWNPADINWTKTPPAQLYPGDAYVDIIGTDTYSPVYPLDLTKWLTGTSAQDGDLATWAADPANRAHYWQYTDASQYAPKGNGNGWSFQDAVDLAAAHNKPLSISETGAGNNGNTTGPVDDPAFPKWLADALAQAEARGVVIQNVDIWATYQNDGNWGFLNGEKPLEAVAWARYFGATDEGAAPSVALTVAPVTAPLVSFSTAPTLLVAPSVVVIGTNTVTAVDQSQKVAVSAVFVPDGAAWRHASAAHPIDTLVGKTIYSVVGVYSDGNVGAVLVTSTPVAVSDNQWNRQVSIIASSAQSPLTTPAIIPSATTAPESGAVQQVETVPILADSVAVYRFFDTVAGTHFFTSSSNERDAIVASRPDLVLESAGLRAIDPSATDPDAAPVYRFFDKVHGTQFLTASTSERDQVIASRPDLAYEAGDTFAEHLHAHAGDTAVFRYFDTRMGTHFYTDSPDEQTIISQTRPDLAFEGVGFYQPN